MLLRSDQICANSKHCRIGRCFVQTFPNYEYVAVMLHIEANRRHLAYG